MTQTAVSDPTLDAIRSARRHRVPLVIRVRLDAHGDAVDLECGDLSATGAFIASAVLFSVGTRLWCSVHAPDGSVFESPAVVVRHQLESPCGMGVVFESGCPLVQRH